MSKVTKRIWRDAATVIIAARNIAETSCKPLCSLKSTVTQQQQQMEDWLNNKHDVNYKLLMLQRNAKSKFMVITSDVFYCAFAMTQLNSPYYDMVKVKLWFLAPSAGIAAKALIKSL